MKCHYEILGIPVDCTRDDLKKAYRKLALEWHPDKNLDRLEEATETFQLIQQAYEILVDPQERAWYDRHRDDILKGDLESNYKDDCLNVYQYFNSSCFKGYNDDEKGFYTVYRNVFNKIYAEDKPFMDEEETDVPEFGCSTSPYDEVVHIFYAYWQSYCTAKSYSWIDKFDLSESRKSGAGRQILRLMEKENKKLRDKQKKIRNEEVRQLVSYVRKRDKRVQAHRKLLEEEKADRAKRMQQQRRKQIEDRIKTLENYQEHEWSSMSQFEQHFNEIEANLDSTFGESAANGTGDDEGTEALKDLYCVACDKDFRSLKSMENHENSKKHKENIAFLKATMEEEEEDLGNNRNEQVPLACDNDENIINSSSEENPSSEALLEELIKSSSKSKKKKKKKVSQPNEERMIFDTYVCDIDSKLNEIQINDRCDKTEPHPDAKVSDADENIGASLKSAPPSKKKGKKDKTQKVETCQEIVGEDNACCLETNEKPSTVCGVCKSDFSSRNKLFDHIKKTGHAVYKTENPKSRSAGDGVKKQQKKGKR